MNVRNWMLVGLLAASALPASAWDVAPATVARHVETLAGDAMRGRGSGEPGNAAAARYAAAVFAKAGLRPLGSARQFDAKAVPNGTGWYQPFAFPTGVVAARGTRIEVRAGGAVWTGTLARDFAVHPLSSSGGADAEIVRVGGAGQDADYAGVDVRGKVVLLPAATGDAAVSIPGRAAVARSKGAAAVLVATERDEAASLAVQGDLASVDAGIPILMVRSGLVDGWMRGTTRSGAGSFATGIRCSVRAEVRRTTKVTANVVGMLEGTDSVLRDEVVVIGAHMDHLGMGGSHSLAEDKRPAIHHGADDNA
ncbi:MAG: M28 family peptidase, partial [Armatimonadota bacterium]